MEEMPLGQPGPRGAQRLRKPWLLCTAALLLLLLYTTGTLIFMLFQPAAKEPCMAKFELLSSKWRVTSSEPVCVNTTSNGMVTILQSGSYLIYGQVTPKKDIKSFASFIVQIIRKERDLQTCESKDFQTLNIGGIFDLQAGDTIYLKFNDDNHIQKNKTYWGITLMPDLPLIS